MQAHLLPTPDDLSIPEIIARFDTEERAIAYFESIRWPNGVECPHCQNKEQNAFWTISGARAGLRQCAVCKKQFRVTVGTIFEDSHIPLHKWLVAWYILSGAKKGISALQMQRHLGLGSYRSAWFLCHRIRHAMQNPIFDRKFTGTVEIDETYVGGPEKRVPWEVRQATGSKKTGHSNKACVVSLVERESGEKRSVVLERVTSDGLGKAIIEHIAPGSVINTDESNRYRKVTKGYVRKSVNHSKKQYAKKDGDSPVSVNYCESSFSLLKRGIVGSFHHVSKKHLGRYMAEFDFKWNTRKESDGKRTVEGLKKATGRRLTYKPLVRKG